MLWVTPLKADSVIIYECCFVCLLQLLAEEKAISEKNAMDRDNAERDARQNETKVCFAVLIRRGFVSYETRSNVFQRKLLR